MVRILVISPEAHGQSLAIRLCMLLSLSNTLVVVRRFDEVELSEFALIAKEEVHLVTYNSLNNDVQRYLYMP